MADLHSKIYSVSYVLHDRRNRYWENFFRIKTCLSKTLLYNKTHLIKHIIFVISVVLLTLVISPEAANGSSITCPAGAGEFQFTSGPEVNQHGEWVTVLCYYGGEIGIGSVELHYQESGTYTGTSPTFPNVSPHCKGEEGTPIWRVSTTHVADATNANTFGVVDIESLLSQVEQQDLAIRCPANEDSLQDTGVTDWNEWCKTEYGSNYRYNASTDLCEPTDWNEYCKTKYGSNYRYDASTDLCEVGNNESCETQLEWCAEKFGLAYCKENVITSAECDNQPVTSIDKQTITSDKFFVDKQIYDATHGVTVKLWGELEQYKRGVPIIVIITKPDGTQNYITPSLSKTGNFEGYYKIGIFDLPGTYSAKAEYDSVTIGSLNFQVEKQEIIKTKQKISGWQTREEKSRSIEELVPPTYDGDMQTFEPSECKINSVPNSNPVYYINGINNMPEEADKNAKLLADTLCKPVKRIYNRTEGLINDLIESYNLKSSMNEDLPPIYELKKNMIKDLKEGKSIELHVHSEGALITSEALRLLQLEEPVLFAENANKIIVNTYGGASWTYPDGPKYHHNNFATDLVGLSVGRTVLNPYNVLLQTNPDYGFPGHTWSGYLKELPAFIISHNMGWFSLNKEGLGKDLINYNPSLVLDVFYNKLDNSDKADVAYHYLKNISEPELKQLPNQLLDVLENSLSEGKITSDEKKQIDRIIFLRGSK